MCIEERICKLEEQLQQMTDDNTQHSDKWVTPKELADIMHCSLNNIYIKIRSGDIYGTRKFGSILRIPMSQFYKTEEHVKTKSVVSKELSIKEKVFGIM